MESAATEGIAGGQVFHGEHDEGDQHNNEKEAER